MIQKHTIDKAVLRDVFYLQLKEYGHDEKVLAHKFIDLLIKELKLEKE